MFKGNPVYPIKALIEAVGLVWAPGIKRYVWAPFIINIGLFVSLLYVLLSSLSGWVDALLGEGTWLEYLYYLIMPIAFLLLLSASAFTFNWIATVIASPFCGFLSEQVAEKYCGKPKLSPEPTLAEVTKRALNRELEKMAHYLPRILLLFALSFVPVINLLVPIIWTFFGAWMLAVQYLDMPADNRGHSFKDFIEELKQQPLTVYAFGGALLGLLMIPILNFFIIPIAVIAATLIWERRWEGVRA